MRLSQKVASTDLLAVARKADAMKKIYPGVLSTHDEYMHGPASYEGNKFINAGKKMKITKSVSPLTPNFNPAGADVPVGVIADILDHAAKENNNLSCILSRIWGQSLIHPIESNDQDWHVNLSGSVAKFNS